MNPADLVFADFEMPVRLWNALNTDYDYDRTGPHNRRMKTAADVIAIGPAFKRRIGIGRVGHAFVRRLILTHCGIDIDPPAAPEKAPNEIAALQADNARLRALVKDAERSGCSESSARLEEDEFCPWCHFLRGDKNGAFKRMHAPDCPAFTPEGEVR